MGALKRILMVCLVCVTAVATQAQNAVAASAHTYVFLLAGQSNMAGRGKPQLQDTTAVSNIYMLNAAMQWVPAREPLHFDKPATVGVGPGFAFAREIMRKDQQAIIYLIPAAVGGSKIDLWLPGAYDSVTRSYPYDNALKRAKKGQAIAPISAILWHQGESDSRPDRCDAYQQKLTALIQQFRSDLQQPDLLFLPAQLTYFTAERTISKQKVNAAIAQVCKAVPYCSLVKSNKLTHLGDTLHYSTPSANLLGIRYAKTYRKAAHKQ
ncbi:MAG: sialate O-acetylesterase [Sediminibacterium sp.]|nr:sialate O-acetylesterase [Sediminibacterium sp.]